MKLSYPTDLKLDPEDIEVRGVLRNLDHDGCIYSRLGFMGSMYFLEGWRREMRQALLMILEEYLKRFSGGITEYGVKNSRQPRQYEGGGVPETYRKQSDSDDTFDVYMRARDPRNDSDPTHWLIMAFGFAKDHPYRRLSALKFHIPPSTVFADPDAICHMFARWAELVGAIHGSGGLAALSTPGEELSTQAYWYPWLQAYPAIDYDAVGSYLSETRRGGYEVPRASNWLTILSEDNIERLGGWDQVKQNLTPDVSAISLAGGLVIRASTLPALGSPETGGIPIGYRTASRIIRPIRYEAYRDGLIKTPPGIADSAEASANLTLAWLRRFD